MYKKLNYRIKTSNIIKLYKKYLKKNIDDLIFEIFNFNSIIYKSDKKKIINFIYKQLNFSNILTRMDNDSPNYICFFTDNFEVLKNILMTDYDLIVLFHAKLIKRFYKLMKKYYLYNNINNNKSVLYNTVRCLILKQIYKKRKKEYIQELKNDKKKSFDLWDNISNICINRKIYLFDKINNKTSIELLDLLKKKKK